MSAPVGWEEGMLSKRWGPGRGAGRGHVSCRFQALGMFLSLAAEWGQPAVRGNALQWRRGLGQSPSGRTRRWRWAAASKSELFGM